MLLKLQYQVRRLETNLQGGALSNTQLDMDNINHRNVDSETPLMVAIKEKNLEKVKLLLECGADVEKADKKGKTFPVISLTLHF